MSLPPLSDEDEQRLHSRLSELEGLASLVSFRADLNFTSGPPNSSWLFDFQAKVVSAPINDLLDRSMDYCRGLTMHEAAHATVTRIFDMVRPTLFAEQHVHALFNSIEDCRIETWIKERNPGAAPWIRMYNDRLFTPLLRGKPIQSWAAQFNMTILSRWWFGQDPPNISPETQAALQATWPAIQKAIAAQPPRIEISSSMIDQAYQNNRTLRLAYLQHDMLSPPSPFEKLVRIRQLQMVYIVVNEILPTYKALHEQQKAQQQRASSDLQRFLQQMRSHHTTQSSNQRRRGKPQDGQPGSSDPQPSSAAPDQQFSPGDADPNVHRALQQALAIDPRDRYLQVWRELSREIDLLANQLIQVLHQRLRLRWLSGYESGARIDIRKMMAFEADPRLYRVLWQRKSTPRKIDPSFTLILDRSGSMNDERIQGAFKGLVLLTEVCTRLSIPLNILSFAADITVELTFDQALGDRERMKLGTLVSRTGGQTMMGDALRDAGKLLRDTPASDNFVIVLGDGLPSDESETRKQLRDLDARGVGCIGLGVGAETENLKNFFQEGMFCVTPTEIAEEFANIIRQKLL